MNPTTPTPDNDPLILGKHRFTSRLILGSGKSSLALIRACIDRADVEIVTLALRRAHGAQENILDYIPKHITRLPNTSGARCAEEALRIARLSRALGCGDLIKLELIGDTRTLLPDNAETIRATRLLSEDGFSVMPYMMPDVADAHALLEAGAICLMPLAAPIGSNRGLETREQLLALRAAFSVPIIVDAGIGRPSQAAEAMELGMDAVMCNTAIATAQDIPRMAEAFALAVQAGRLAHLAGPGRILSQGGESSSPLTDFLYEETPRHE
ncbi:Thiazole biosynthesis protein ThiG [Clostridiaceae bacterium JG1575]|nr:Thiazole biosynthesis protein ThiG [Clostridiaceae bacterium JG1575]